MGNGRLSQERMQEAINLVAKYGSVAAAAAAVGMPRTTMDSRVQAARRAKVAPTEKSAPTIEETNLSGVIEGLRRENDRLKVELEKAARPRFSVRQDSSTGSEKIRIVAVGDVHDSPKIPDKSRFAWIGAYANDVKPDILLQIGDMFTMDSLNTHIPNENYDGKAKPSFIADIASGHQALDALCSRLNWGCEKHETDGNHERRLYAFENTAPETVGMMQRDYDHLLESHGFTHSPYGMIQYYGGVGFVHAAINTLGKTYGGKNCLPTIANDSVSDLVVGHSHRGRVHQSPKIGQRYPTTIIDLGCALPNGFVEDYAKHALNGWTYGIYDLLIQHGHIQAAKFVSMDELEERYG